MSTQHLILAFAAIALCACAKIESEPNSFDCGVEPEATISIPIVCEGQTAATKAYYYEESSYWTYNWENRDQFQYFTFMRGEETGSDFVSVTKTVNSTVMNYRASALTLGNTLYSYFVQSILNEEEIENEDPTALTLAIPTHQTTDEIPETYTESIDPSFELSTLSLEKSTYKATEGGTFNTVPIGDNIVEFTIDRYNSDFTYLCQLEDGKGGVSDFTVGPNGKGSVTVSFDDYESGKLEQYTKFKIYVKGYSGNFVTVKVEATRKSTGSTSSGRTTTYAVSSPGHGTEIGTTIVPAEGEKPYPIRDCMPCVSKGKLITSTLLRYPEDIANSMTMYMLGAAVEFKIYSSTGSYVGEEIQFVEFETTEPCAGFFNYDITSESLQISGYEETVVRSDVSECQYKVPKTKGAIPSVYMIVAPGTYDAEIRVITKDANENLWQYKFTTSGQEITRANRKPFGTNLNSANAVRSPYDPDGTGGIAEDEDL